MCAAMSRACPHCGQTIRAEAVACRYCKKRISAPAGPAQPAAPGQPAAPQAAARPPAAATAGQCPKCGTALAENAVLCVNWGHHLKYGVGATTVAKARKAGGAARKIGLALTVSGVGCVLGGLVWALIAYFFHVEIGILAIGIGFLGGQVTEHVPLWARIWATVSLWDILRCILALSTAFGMASREQ